MGVTGAERKVPGLQAWDESECLSMKQEALPFRAGSFSRMRQMAPDIPVNGDKGQIPQLSDQMVTGAGMCTSCLF